jgi:hypothetical protein
MAALVYLSIKSGKNARLCIARLRRGGGKAL